VSLSLTADAQLMAKARPDLFYAYVGAGQVVDAQENEAVNYARVLDKAKTLSDAKAVAELQASGPPPYPVMKALTTQRIWAQTFEHADSYVATEQTSSLYAPGYGYLHRAHDVSSRHENWIARPWGRTSQFPYSYSKGLTTTLRPLNSQRLTSIQSTRPKRNS
jgi:hypothetical protein